MTLQRGLGCLPLWQQFILPDMDFIEQALAASVRWQTPQGVRATNTPAMRTIRLKAEKSLNMV
jgi:hypothetical protein